ncbi:MAG: hypothetical protein K8U03_21100 [Planctomycetia bacterium]|nr:hypothetical protein [Planctomycetia bacterium]
MLRASALCEAVKVIGQHMSISSSKIRAELLSKCLPLFVEMRELTRVRFTKQASYILAGVDEYETAIIALATLNDGQISAGCLNGKNACPVCGNDTHANHPHGCRNCSEAFMAAYDKLDSSEGFATWAI